MPSSILFTREVLSPEDRQRLEQQGYAVKVASPNLTEDELIAALDGVDAYVLAGNEHATRRVIASSPSLRVIAFFGVSYEAYIDVEAATEHGVIVANTPGANSQAVAEFTVALMLDVARHLSHLIEGITRGEWRECTAWNLQGKALGIVGAGMIGSRVARIAHNGFGMSIGYTSRSAKPALDRDMAAKFLPLDRLLQESDVVSLHVPLTAETQGMIGASQLGMMKRTAVLINTSRAHVVDPHALHKALTEEAIAAAAFDGYYEEPAPAPDHDPYGLVDLPHDHMLISPHAGYGTHDAVRAMMDMSLKSVLAVLEGNTVPNVVNPDCLKRVGSGT